MTKRTHTRTHAHLTPKTFDSSVVYFAQIGFTQNKSTEKKNFGSCDAKNREMHNVLTHCTHRRQEMQRMLNAGKCEKSATTTSLPRAHNKYNGIPQQNLMGRD